MLILALDTTTRAGSLAIARDGRLLDVGGGDPSRTHAERLPGAILDALTRHGLGLGDVDVYGVAVGPGSFTGLRIGIATIQGLAFAHARPVVGVSALDALVEAAGPPPAMAPEAAVTPASPVRAAWMDAQRGEVFARLYVAARSAWQPLTDPAVDRPDAVLASWGGLLEGREAVELVGDGALVHRPAVRSGLGPRARIVEPVPLLAPAIAALAAREASAGRAVPPGAVRPLYIRRPDAELARDRKARS
jgi:tRNA threonylcarbamoyladenosine biosynthesis protein TsaB